MLAVVPLVELAVLRGIRAPDEAAVDDLHRTVAARGAELRTDPLVERVVLPYFETGPRGPQLRIELAQLGERRRRVFSVDLRHGQVLRSSHERVLAAEQILVA